MESKQPSEKAMENLYSFLNRVLPKYADVIDTQHQSRRLPRRRQRVQFAEGDVK